MGDVLLASPNRPFPLLSVNNRQQYDNELRRVYVYNGQNFR